MRMRRVCYPQIWDEEFSLFRIFSCVRERQLLPAVCPIVVVEKTKLETVCLVALILRHKIWLHAGVLACEMRKR